MSRAEALIVIIGLVATFWCAWLLGKDFADRRYAKHPVRTFVAAQCEVGKMLLPSGSYDVCYRVNSVAGVVLSLSEAASRESISCSQPPFLSPLTKPSTSPENNFAAEQDAVWWRTKEFAFGAKTIKVYPGRHCVTISDEHGGETTCLPAK